MAHGPTYRVRFRRRREGRTDYRKRLALLKSGMPRLVVRRQNNNTIVQFVRYAPEGDVVVAGGSARDLAKLGWDRHAGSEPAAYLAGYRVGKMALAHGIDEAVLDVGLERPDGGRVRAAMQGAVDAGVDVARGDNYGADEDRVSGEHIDDGLGALVGTVKDKIDEEAA